MGEARTTKWRMETVVVVDRLCRRTEQNGREANELVVAAGDARARWRREGFGQLLAVRLEIDERDRDGNGRSCGIKQPPFEIRSPGLS